MIPCAHPFFSRLRNVKRNSRDWTHKVPGWWQSSMQIHAVSLIGCYAVWFFRTKKNKHKSNLRWICIELCHHHGVLFVPNLRLLLHWENIKRTKGEVNLHAILHHFLIVLLLWKPILRLGKGNSEACKISCSFYLLKATVSCMSLIPSFIKWNFGKVGTNEW